MKTIAIIPARMSASRFPGKPLAQISGMAMIGHIYKRTSLESIFDEVYVATCDEEIKNYIESIGGKAVMTKDTHERCTDRTAEALEKIEKENQCKYDIIGMIQGDEPTVVPEIFKTALSGFKNNPEADVVNIMNRIQSNDEFISPNAVKVVVNPNHEAIYFSREPIPSTKKFNKEFPKYRQTGMIFFKRDYLLKYQQMTPSFLEEIESVDMMRIIEHGDKIQMILSETPCLAVDIPDDIKPVELFFKTDLYIKKYI